MAATKMVRTPFERTDHSNNQGGNEPALTIQPHCSRKYPNMADRKLSFAVYDRDLKNLIGLNGAIVFGWLLNFLHSKQTPKPNGRVKDGRRWARFSYETLHLQSDVLDSQKTLTRTINELEKLGLVVSVPCGNGKDYTIHFHRLRELIGDAHYTLYTESINVNGLDDWDLPLVIEKKERKQREITQNGQSKATQNGESEIIQEYPEMTSGLPKMDNQITQNGQSPIDIESLILPILDSTTPPTSVGDADASAAPDPLPEKVISMRQLIFGYWQRLTYGDVIPDKDQKTAIGNAIDFMRRGHGEEFVYDALEEGRFEAYLRLTDDWFVEDKIDRPNQLQGSFNRMVSYEKKNGRDWFKEFTTKFPDWRVTARGQYSAFREAMPAMAKRAKDKKTSSSLASWQTRPYGETPVAPTTAEAKAEARQRLRD